MTTTTVAVTGATGFVGRNIVAQLLDAGYAVRALVRDRAKARAVLPKSERLTLVEGDATDAPALARLVQGSGAAIHLIGIIREAGRGQTFHRLHVESTRAMLAAVQAAGVGRYIQMSALGVSGDGHCAYQRTKWQAEELVRSSALRWTIFRPGMILGEGSGFLDMVEKWCAGDAPPYFFLPYFRKVVEDKSVPLGPMNEYDPIVQPVAVEDVARAFVTSLSRDGSVGETYNLVGPERLAWPTLLRRLAAIYGQPKMVPFGVPGIIAAGVAQAAAFVGLGAFLPFDHGMAVMGASDSVAESQKAAAHLDWRPGPAMPEFSEFQPAVHS